jgi:tetratricopeptide (TPR) repeat protein
LNPDEGKVFIRMKWSKLISSLVFVCGSSAGLALAQAPAPGSDPFVAAGDRFYAAKDYLQALQNYQWALANNPKNAEAYDGMGDCYEALKQDDKALTAYRWALTYDPQNKLLAQKVSRLSSPPVSLPPIVPDYPRTKKSPLLSGFLSAVIPGAGQYYNGTPNEVLKGCIMDTGIILGVVIIVEADNYTPVFPNESIGAAFATDLGAVALIGGCYLWSVIDAPTSSDEINWEVDHPKRAGADLNLHLTLLDNVDPRPVPAGEMCLRF